MTNPYDIARPYVPCRYVEEDRIKRITATVAVGEEEYKFGKTEMEERELIREIAYGIAEKLFEFKKIERYFDNNSVVYTTSFDIIVPK